jgi:hypothetical protein
VVFDVNTIIVILVQVQVTTKQITNKENYLAVRTVVAYEHDYLIVFFQSRAAIVVVALLPTLAITRMSSLFNSSNLLCMTRSPWFASV